MGFVAIAILPPSGQRTTDGMMEFASKLRLY
jgi:hypothetical protein